MRKKKRIESVIDYSYRKNRTFKEFQAYIRENPDENVVELDTVHGSNKTGNVMLTMLFRNCNFMIIFLMPECNKECVKQVFDNLTELLGIEAFRTIFPIILTDNGSEFKGAEELENDKMTTPRTRMFYCDPLASWQKAKLEKNHEYIRKVILKGVALIGQTQEDMTLLTNHINSTARASLNGRTPYELAQLLLPMRLFEAIKLGLIEADKVTLKPSLLKH